MHSFSSYLGGSEKYSWFPITVAQGNMFVIERELLVALVFLDLDIIVVSLRFMRVFLEEEDFEMEDLRTMKEKKRKAKEAIFIVKILFSLYIDRWHKEGWHMSPPER